MFFSLFSQVLLERTCDKGGGGQSRGVLFKNLTFTAGEGEGVVY